MSKDVEGEEMYSRVRDLLRLEITVTSRATLMQSTPTPTSSSPSNRGGSRRQPHLEQQNPYRQASPTPFPRQDYLPPSSTDHHDFSPSTFQRQRAISSYALESATVSFPEPQLYRSGSSKATVTYRPLTPTNQDFRNDLRTTPRGPSPALQPALPPRNSVANPETEGIQVTI
jgi:hypothetical protein